MTSLEEHNALVQRERPISFVDMCRGIGWDYTRDDSGDLMKYDTKNNMSVLYGEGPVTLFDGSPSDVRPEVLTQETAAQIPATSKNLDFMDEWLED